MNIAVQDLTVLIVEDNVSNFVLMARMLGFLGVTCEWKTSGFEVVEYAERCRVSTYPDGYSPALEDGCQALRKLRASDHSLRPVVAVTATPVKTS
jgi:two-component system cell cycle response regulator DivK